MYKIGLSFNTSAGGSTIAYMEFLGDGRVLRTKGVLLDVLVREVKAQVWRGKRTDRIHMLIYPRGASPRPISHFSSRPLVKGDEVWILHGPGRLFLLRKSGNRHILLRRIPVYRLKYTEVENGEFMEFGVDWEAETKTLQIRYFMRAASTVYYDGKPEKHIKSQAITSLAIARSCDL